MRKITAADELDRSTDLAARNVEQLVELFPAAVAEGKVDFEVLRQLLGEQINAPDERFGLNWIGKAASRQQALQPSTGGDRRMDSPRKTLDSLSEKV